MAVVRVRSRDAVYIYRQDQRFGETTRLPLHSKRASTFLQNIDTAGQITRRDVPEGILQEVSTYGEQQWHNIYTNKSKVADRGCREFCCRSLAGTADSILAEDMGVRLLRLL